MAIFPWMKVYLPKPKFIFSVLIHAAIYYSDAKLWGNYYESQSDTDYRYLPITPEKYVIPVLGKAYYALNEAEFAPYYQQINLNTFLIGYGNNRAGEGYVPILVIAI